jgi:hypothetical protein
MLEERTMKDQQKLAEFLSDLVNLTAPACSARIASGTFPEVQRWRMARVAERSF